MANLNLSEFGEKLFVADADHTFIWDSAMSISKRVSRNSWLNSGTLTSDAPVTISQTWNAGSNVMTALKVVATDTASGATSNLLELWAGNAATLKFRVDKNGDFSGRTLLASGVIALTSSGSYYTGYLNGLYIDHSAFIANQGAYIGFSAVNNAASNGADVKLVRDGAPNTLALRNGGLPQTFRVYNTYSNAGNDYERVAFAWAGNTAFLDVGASGTGTRRDLNIGAQNVSLLSGSGPTLRWQINSSGHFIAAADNSYDIGATNANRPKNVFAAGLLQAGATGVIGFNTRSYLKSPSDGVMTLVNTAETDFNRLQLGGAADTFPAIVRDGAGIKFTGAAAGSTAWIKVPPVAVSALPLAATAGAGARAFVNDALTPTFGSAVTGGGAVLVPVYSDGSVWNVG